MNNEERIAALEQQLAELRGEIERLHDWEAHQRSGIESVVRALELRIDALIDEMARALDKVRPGHGAALRERMRKKVVAALKRERGMKE